MTEIEEKVKDDEEVSEVRPVETHKHIGSARICNGHSLFMWLDGEVSKVPEEDFEGVVLMNGATRKKLITKEGAYYRGALNLENAYKIFARKGFPIKAEGIGRTEAFRRVVGS